MTGFKEGSFPFEFGPPDRAKLFRHGGSQAVRLPKAFRFEGQEVEISRDGDKVILSPVTRAKPARTAEELKALWAEIDALRGDDVLVRPPQPEFRDLGFDD